MRRHHRHHRLVLVLVLVLIRLTSSSTSLRKYLWFVCLQQRAHMRDRRDRADRAERLIPDQPRSLKTHFDLWMAGAEAFKHLLEIY